MSRELQLHLGSEIEFFSDYEVAQPALEEYYNNQWEVNDFHVINKSLGENLEALFKWSGRLIERSKRGDMSFAGFQHGSGGPVFSGVHIHLQVRGDGRRDQGMERSDKEDFARRLSKVVMADIIRYHGMTFRCMTSHHLHGACRMSQYNYKQRAKFAPVIYHTGFDTYELRCIEPAMLYTEGGQSALKSILSRAYDYLCGKNVRIHKRYNMMAEKLAELPGDMTHEGHAQEYIDYVKWLQRDKIPVHFSMLMRNSNSEVRVRYEDLVARRGVVAGKELLYASPLSHGDTEPQAVRGVVRNPGELVTDFHARVEASDRTRSIESASMQLRFNADGCPVRPDRGRHEDVGSWERRAREYHEYRRQWVHNYPHSTANPFARASSQARRWERANAPHSEENPHPRGCLEAQRWEERHAVEANGLLSAMRQHLPGYTVEVGYVFRAVSANGREGYAVVAKDGGPRWSETVPTTVPERHGFTNVNRIHIQPSYVDVISPDFVSSPSSISGRDCRRAVFNSRYQSFIVDDVREESDDE